MDPASMPAWGSTPTSSGNLAGSIGQLAPLATDYHGAQTGVGINQVSNAVSQPSGVLANFGHWLGGAATQVGHISADVAGWLGQQTLSLATAPIRYGQTEGQGILDNIQLGSIQAQNKAQSARMDTLNSQYKAGHINKQQYISALNSLMQDESNTSSQETALLHRLPEDQSQAIQATVDTASTLVTVLTAGFGKAFATGVTAKGLEPMAAKTTADFLASSSADTFFGSVERQVASLASDPGLLGKLAQPGQKFLQFATAEVVSTGEKMTAAQIARATAVNLAFKYPLYFNAMGPGFGTQLYQELDQKKYGDAVMTLAFNSALLLSGGPIGYALSKVGKGVDLLKGAMFGKTAFFDEVSKAVGNGDSAGMFNAVNAITDPEMKADVIKQLSAVEATNLNAVGGDAKAAAWRLVKGMASYEGTTLNNFTHEELLNNMVNFAKAQRLADSYSQQLGKAITVGRVDARALDNIATGLTKSDVEAASATDALGQLPTAQPEAVDMSKAPDFLQPEGAKPLPEPLQKLQSSLPEGYKVTPGGDVMGPDGKELTTGQLQDLTQAPYLTEFEKATRENDVATMNRIAKEHPGDNRVSMGSINKEPNLKGIVQNAERLPAKTAEEKAALMAKARQVATSEETGLAPGFTWSKDGSILDAQGKTLTTGQYQQAIQPPFLTEFEKAAGKGDLATMNRLVAEHPGDNRLMIPETQTPVAKRFQAWETMKMQNPNQAWANNANFDKQIKALIQKYADDPTGLESSIRKITASFSVEGMPESASRELAKMGYIAIKPVDLEAPFVEGAGKITTRFASKSDDFFMKAVQPLPVLGFLGDTITRFGLSPDASSQRVYQMFNENIAQDLKGAGIIGDIKGETDQQSADLLMKQLSNYARDPARKLPVTDFRMLTAKDIEAATGRTMQDARSIQNAISRAYIQVPLAVRGLGDRAVDFLYAGPQGAISRRYFRLQGALRFSWNPFFEYMRVIPKTEILTETQGGGVLESMFMGRVGRLGEVRQMLRSSGAFDEAGIVRLGAEAAGQDVVLEGVSAKAFATMSPDEVRVARNISKHLLPMQERSIAGLVMSQADRMGMTVEDYMHSYPMQVRDTVQAIAQYDRKANFLNSPMMRTLNVAIFPIRFETKVATFMAKALARQPLMTQVAVIHGLMQAHTWLNSPEGMAWYARNSTAIQLFNYITPIAEMDKVFESLLPGHDHSLGNFGELGGLPFGWIPQLTDAEGWTHFNQPGIDASSGNPIPSYVPITDRGQIAIAVQDLIGSLFSYPGATAGLPSKASITRAVALQITMADKSKDLKLQTPTNLSQSQLDYSAAVKAASANQVPAGQTVAQQPGTVPSQTVKGLKVPQMDSSLLHPTLKPSQTSATTKKKKKGEYIPALLPGQTQLGVLPS